MKKKINLFLFLIMLFFYIKVSSEPLNPEIQPEPTSKFQKNKFSSIYNNFVVVTANKLATEAGYKILKKGGNAVDAAVTIQFVLGLVEPQSSGIGGGSFITYYDKKTRKIISYEGREKAPKEIEESIFLNDNNKPKKFWEAAIGGSSVGVPGTLKAFFQLHKKFGKLSWNEVLKPVYELAEDGFIPPPRLLNAIKKERFLFKTNENSIFKKILKEPEKKFYNYAYANLIKKISKQPNDFYTGEIAKNIVSVIKNAPNPGKLSLNDMNSYKPVIQEAFCHVLDSGYKICGPNLPSSGTICVIQALILFEELIEKNPKIKKPNEFPLVEVLEILDFIYYLRSIYLGDDEFVDVNVSSILKKDFLIKNLGIHKQRNKLTEINNIKELLNSTSHFSVVDSQKNIISSTSSIESSFGSRLTVSGFFLNNQLTDFSFKLYDSNGELKKNRPQGGKRPLSSMAPLIIFNKNDEFLLTIGSPGGKAIISYITRVLIDILYFGEKPEDSINKPNYLSINGNIILEKGYKEFTLEKKILFKNLTSGLAIIQKREDGLLGAVDKRRDGRVLGY